MKKIKYEDMVKESAKLFLKEMIAADVYNFNAHAGSSKLDKQIEKLYNITWNNNDHEFGAKQDKIVKDGKKYLNKILRSIVIK